MNEVEIIPAPRNIQSLIVNFRNKQLMVDKDLATLYQVSTKALNQAVKRNSQRFPKSFMFQLDNAEKSELVTNCDRFNSLKHSTSNPYVFTEQGVAMLSAVLRSEIAIQVSIQIMEAFVQMRSLVADNFQLHQRLNQVEENQQESNKKINLLLDAMEAGSLTPTQGIFFDGQVFDAYLFATQLIKQATQEIILLDNYLDETVLEMLNARQPQVTVTLLTKNLTNKLELATQKYNQQYSQEYAPIILKQLTKSHDRFLILDRTKIYHLGASLKDLGKKWFAFSQLEIDPQLLLTQAEID